jgi:hypothetical protein
MDSSLQFNPRLYEAIDLEDGIYLRFEIPSRPPTNRSVSPAPKTVYITYWERESTCP